MEWPGFLESSSSQEPTFALFGATSHDNREVAAQSDQWTPEEKQFFENAFSSFNNLGSQTFFEYVASKLPHKSMEDIKNHYITLFKDVETENPIPKDNVVVYDDDHHQQHYQVPQEDDSDMEATLNDVPPQVENNRPRRRRGIPWTEGEHQLFLMGLNRFGKGDWKSISRHYVVTKTPTQVASHAQKYFCRRNNMTPAERRRPSINDIQTVTLNLRTPTTAHVATTHPINNDILAYNNNHQVGSSSTLFRYPSYTFGGPTFNNNSNTDFGRFVNQGEASGSSSSVMGQNNNNNNNNLHRPMSPRPFLSMYLSSAGRNNREA
ncbi:transcription factor SRM1-like [Lycium barbarum]|uniref:transcription factor SRM1-like n=1 Tax=Lycium barbarum TaxID=112863 RepID=UPI00293F662C|nr:transcription factor SRM1-like [Lycium barbarum]